MEQEPTRVETDNTMYGEMTVTSKDRRQGEDGTKTATPLHPAM